MAEVPVFVSGQPGFTNKLNDLVDVIRQLIERDEARKAEIAELRTRVEKAAKPKTTRSTARKTATSE